jgi:hypothetical protein
MLRGAFMAGCMLLASAAAAQGVDYSLDATAAFYGDNTEFFNPFRDGETILGAHALVFGEARTSDRLAVRAGVSANQRFGSSRAFDQLRPVISLIVGSARSRLILGTIETRQRRYGTGPDRSGPHSLLPPLQVETLAFTRPWEAGMQWIIDTSVIKHDSWVNWQRLGTTSQRERFDAGSTSRFKVHRAITIGGDFHVVHDGGQLTDVGAVGESIAGAAGGEIGGPAGNFDRIALEAYVLGSRNVPDRAAPLSIRSGFATFLRASAEKNHWRVHGIVYRGDDFITREGDTTYLSIRLDGLDYRNLRDYQEAGLSRLFPLAKDSFLEASFRGYHVENQFEYSFRIFAVAKLRID